MAQRKSGRRWLLGIHGLYSSDRHCGCLSGFRSAASRRPWHNHDSRFYDRNRYASFRWRVGLLGTVAQFLIARAQGRGRNRPDGVTSREAQQAIREGVTPRKMSAGTVRLGPDAHMVYDVSGEDFIRFLAINDGPIQSYETHYLQSEQVTLDGSLLVDNSIDGKWDGLVRIETTLGATDQAALASLVTDYGPWTSDHRCRGVAAVYIKQTPVPASDARARHIHAELFYNCVIKAASDIYDPRDQTTGWSDNAALVALWYLRHPQGRNLPDTLIDFDSFSVAADTCDELVTLAAGGTEKRYRSNATIARDEEPNDVLQRMLENMDASPTFDSEGKMGVRISTAAVTNLLTFTEDQVRETSFRSYQRAVDRYDRVEGAITSIDHEYQEISTSWGNETGLATNGARIFEYNLPYCPTHTQAQRLMKKRFLRLTAAEQGVIQTDLSGYFAWPGTTVVLGWDTAETDKPLRVKSRQLNFSDSGWSVILEVESISDDYDVWDAEESEQPALAGNKFIRIVAICADWCDFDVG